MKAKPGKQAAEVAEPQTPRKYVARGIWRLPAESLAQLDRWLLEENRTYIETVALVLEQFAFKTSTSALAEYRAKRVAQIAAGTNRRAPLMKVEQPFEIVLRFSRDGQISASARLIKKEGN